MNSLIGWSYKTFSNPKLHLKNSMVLQSFWVVWSDSHQLNINLYFCRQAHVFENFCFFLYSKHYFSPFFSPPFFFPLNTRKTPNTLLLLLDEIESMEVTQKQNKLAFISIACKQHYIKSFEREFGCKNEFCALLNHNVIFSDASSHLG